MDKVCSGWDVSIRRACRNLAVDTSAYHYKSRRRGQVDLEHRIKEIAETCMRHGYRRVHLVPQCEGWGAAAKGGLKETTTLFHAVGEAEAIAIARKSKLEPGVNSLLGKWVAEREIDERTWGDKLNGPGKSRRVEITMGKAKAEQLIRKDRLDGIEPARYGEIEQFEGALLRVLDRWKQYQ